MTKENEHGKTLNKAEVKQRVKTLLGDDIAEYWLNALIESADDAIVSKTLEGIITSWNKGAERIFGYTADEIIGKPVLVLIPPDHHNEEPAILAKIKSGERIEHYETIRVTKDGRLINISLTVSPIKTPDGKIIGASKIARDITALKQAEARMKEALEQAQAAKAEAEAANRAKDEFLATLSHELRTPLNAILGWSKMMTDSRLEEGDQLRALQTIQRNARVQAQLIDDILDVSRIISGKLKLKVRPIELSTIVESAVESVLPAAQAKEIRLQRVLDSGSSMISGDSNRLQQVIWNLLSNAVKFTPKGGRVQIRLERVNSHVEIIVSDTGIGIAPKVLPFIFDRFRQADSATTRQHGGLGLGLAIVRHLVEMHGGSVEAESGGEGQGATFTVRLPLVALRSIDVVPEADERVHPTEGKDIPFECTPELEGLHILVVDDEEDGRALVTTVLEKCGAKVTAVDSAPAALRVLSETRTDILISDIGMPGEDGYSLIRKVRALPAEQGGQIPAAALTAYARVEDRMRVLRSGFQIHLPKPVEPAELVAVVASLSGRHTE
ncbi:MAG TPA: ATP-binding protein [Pyrinomonadaceae bacterium]|jgi:PAS domain S-box-containing protein